MITEELEEFARIYSDCHVVITCRIAAIDYELEPTFTYLEVADFASDQVELFIRAWFWDESNKEDSMATANRMLAERAKPEHKGIRDLTRNPLLLTLLCLSYEATKSIPSRRVEIYEEAFEALLRKWDNSKGVDRGTAYKDLSFVRRRQMFARFAFDTFRVGKVLFDQSQLEKWLVEYLKNVPEIDTSKIEPEEMLYEIIAQHGVFAQQAYRLYSFSHLTFHEYYFAKYVAENSTPQLLQQLADRISDGRWREVILMTASLAPDATNFLRELLTKLQKMATSDNELMQLISIVWRSVNASQAGYNRSATGLYFLAHAFSRTPDIDTVCASIFDHSHALACKLDRRLDQDIYIGRSIELAASLIYTLDQEPRRTLDRTPAIDRVTQRHFDRERILDFADSLSAIIMWYKEHGFTDLHMRLVAIRRPGKNSEGLEWRNYANQVRLILEQSNELAPFRLLANEASDVKKTLLDQNRITVSTIDLVYRYILACHLFHECLQLGFTSDHETFENAIFAPV